MMDKNDTHTLNDIKQSAYTWPGLHLGVLGHPVSHSLSPQMHEAALAACNLKGRYLRFDIAPDELSEALRHLHAAHFDGLNLTVPHKVAAIPLLAKIDPLAERIGAVNTLRWTSSGYHGFNTDVYGVLKTLEEHFPVHLKNRDPIYIVGAGGAARAVFGALEQLSARPVYVFNRSQDRLDALREDFYGPDYHHYHLSDFPSQIPPSGICIDTTSAGPASTTPGSSLPSFESFPESWSFFDLSYGPCTGALYQSAKSTNRPHTDGLPMLLHQATQAFQIFTNHPAPIPVMKASLQAATQP